MIIISIVEHAEDGTVEREIVSRYRPEQFRWFAGQILKKYVSGIDDDDIRKIITDVDVVREAGLASDVVSNRYLFTRHTVEVACARIPIQ